MKNENYFWYFPTFPKVNLPDLKDNKDLVKPISHVLWTNQTLPSGGKAFRDTLMEKVVQ